MSARLLIVTIILIGISIALIGGDGDGRVTSDDLWRWGHQCAESIVWLLGFIVVNSIVNQIFWERWVTGRTGRPVPALLKTITTLILFSICLAVISTNVFGQSIIGALAFGGGLSIILGIALQKMIEDFFSGLAINLERSFQIGDFIKLNNRRLGDEVVIGRVVALNWRTTRLERTDGTLVVVPNNLFTSMVVTNLSLPEVHSRFELSFCVEFNTSSDRVLNILDAAVRAAPSVLDTPEPKVRIDHIDHRGVNYVIRYWINPTLGSPLRARSEVNHAVLKHFEFSGINLAYQRLDIAQVQVAEQSEHLSGLPALLSRLPLFSELDEHSLHIIAEASHSRRLYPNELLVQSGEEGNSMFFIVEGLIEVLLDVQASETIEEDQLKVAVIGPGEYLGEMSLMTGEPRSATAKAKTMALVYEIDKVSLENIFEREPLLLDVIAETITKRKRAQDLALDEAEERACLRDIEDDRDQLLEKMKRFFKL